MGQLRRDLVTHRNVVLIFLASWLVLLIVTGLTWYGGIPPWLFFIHLLLLPFAAGYATSGFRLNSGLAGLLVGLLDLLVIGFIPLSRMSLRAPYVPTPEEIAMQQTAGGSAEVLLWAVLMGVPAFFLGRWGGAVGHRHPFPAGR